MKSIVYGFFIASLCISSVQQLYSQEQEISTLGGNFQVDVQSYKADSLIGAQAVPEKTRMNSFLNLNYTKGNFSAGIRYEAYLKEILGFSPNWGGKEGNNGIGYRYARYTNNDYDVTIGNFYEQFGSGMILRTYEERGLGLDNALDGIRVRLTMLKGVTLTGVYGKQRSFFSQGPGIIRGFDGEVNIDDFLQNFNSGNSAGNVLLPDGWQLRLGGGVVSKYEQDLDPIYVLPENVLAWNTRMAFSAGSFTLNAEYAHKINDPTNTNNYTYNDGQALYVNTGFSEPGIGISLTFKALDNMDFRSSRRSQLTDLVMNYLPALTKQYTYRLLTLYPYATQPNGEIGFQADFLYTFKKGTDLGGKYGTTINVNYSRVHAGDTSMLTDSISRSGNLYTSRFLNFGQKKYFEDINIEVQKQWSKEFKTNFGFMRQYYLKELIELAPTTGTVISTVFTSEFIYSLTPTNTIRFEFQHMAARHAAVDARGEIIKEADGSDRKPKLDNNNGSWIYGLVEYTVAPSWFFSVFNEYNYGNDDPERRLHYLSGNVIYVKDALRVALGYGRVRGGILCVGGVCRPVPASNGFSLSISSTF
jgi:hypothetical protein